MTGERNTNQVRPGYTRWERAIVDFSKGMVHYVGIDSGIAMLAVQFEEQVPVGRQRRCIYADLSLASRRDYHSFLKKDQLIRLIR